MSHRGSAAKIVALALVLGLQLAFLPPVAADGGATLAGAVIDTDAKQPLDGAVLYAGDSQTGRIYTSERTDDSGSFAFSDLPAAVYDLAVEKNGGLYVVEAPVRLAPGQMREVQVAINAKAAPDPETAAKKGVKKSFLDNPVMATFAIIGGAVVVGALISEADDADEGLASPFQPF